MRSSLKKYLPKIIINFLNESYLWNHNPYSLKKINLDTNLSDFFIWSNECSKIEFMAENIDQAWTDLGRELKSDIDRNLLSAQLVKAITERLNQHHQFGLAPMLDEWQKQDYFYNQNIALHAGDKVTRGVCKGINQSGALLIEIDGKVQPIYGGEVSLRAG